MEIGRGQLTAQSGATLYVQSVHTYSVYKCCVRSVACVGRPTSITTRASRTALTRLVRRLYLAKGGGERAAAATKNVVVEQHGGIGSS